MNDEYILALMLPEGSDAALLAFLNTMEEEFGFAYPLPPMIPLAAFPRPFPPDRVDRQALKELPPLRFRGMADEAEGTLLLPDEESLIPRGAACLRSIHGKEKPRPLTRSIFTWKGLLLQPAGFPGPAAGRKEPPQPPQTAWRTYRLALLHIRWRQDPWWLHVRWEILWNIRKARTR